MNNFLRPKVNWKNLFILVSVIAVIELAVIIILLGR